MRSKKPEPREEPDQLRRYQREIRLVRPGRKSRALRSQVRRILDRLRRAALRDRVPFVAGKGTTRGALHFSIERVGLVLRILWGARDEQHDVRARSGGR